MTNKPSDIYEEVFDEAYQLGRTHAHELAVASMIPKSEVRESLLDILQTNGFVGFSDEEWNGAQKIVRIIASRLNLIENKK